MIGFIQKPPLAAILLPFLFIAVLCNLNGCIHHRYITTIRPDGSVSHTYEAIGDSTDLYDDCITLPSGFWWRIETEVDYDSAGDPVHTYRGILNLSSVRYIPVSYAPETVRYPEIFLRHPIDYFRFDAGIAFVILYRQTFISRGKEAKYGNILNHLSPEGRAFLDSASSDSLSEEERSLLEAEYLSGMVVWTRSMMIRRCQAVLSRALEMHPDVSFTEENLSDAMAIAEDHINRWSPYDDGESLLLGEIELWNGVGKPAMNQMVSALTFIGNTTFFEDLEMLGDLYQWEFDITKDLEDDEFEVQITVPGIRFYHNADGKESGALIWEFSGEDFFDSDVVIIAQSIYFRWLPTSILGFVVLAIVAVVILRKSNRKMVLPNS